MYYFSNTSKKRLTTCHIDLQTIMYEAIKITNIDFGIAEGHRSIVLQQKYYKQGKSKIDGINKMGKHNYNPSLAVDIYAYVNGKAIWDKEHLSYLSGIIHAVTELLYKEGKITHKIRWGGNWDMDGTILLDQSFDDRPHYELINA
jgi:peptidoglycan LD-endopeptidase CwlK